MDSKTIRRRNLELLLLEVGGGRAVQELAERVETDPNYISQLKHGKRGIGDSFARRLECAMEKSHGWMDHIHDRHGRALTEQAIEEVIALQSAPTHIREAVRKLISPQLADPSQGDAA